MKIRLISIAPLLAACSAASASERSVFFVEPADGTTASTTL
jgi:hypothetical protein